MSFFHVGAKLVPSVSVYIPTTAVHGVRDEMDARSGGNISMHEQMDRSCLRGYVCSMLGSRYHCASWMGKHLQGILGSPYCEASRQTKDFSNLR